MTCIAEACAYAVRSATFAGVTFWNTLRSTSINESLVLLRHDDVMMTSNHRSVLSNHIFQTINSTTPVYLRNIIFYDDFHSSNSTSGVYFHLTGTSTKSLLGLQWRHLLSNPNLAIYGRCGTWYGMLRLRFCCCSSGFVSFHIRIRFWSWKNWTISWLTYP